MSKVPSKKRVSAMLQADLRNAFIIGHSDGQKKEYRIELRFETLEESQRCHILILAFADPDSRATFVKQGLLTND